MRFFGRKTETAELLKIREASKREARMTVVTGRRRVGKTELIRHALDDGKTPFVSPMCGSGTPAIEAAMVAMNKAPGLLKGHFAFQSIKGYSSIIPGESAPRVAPRQYVGASPEQIWKELVMDAAAAEKKEGIPPIIATDISPEAVDNAHSNAIAAGVAQYITFKACDFADTPVPESERVKAARVCMGRRNFPSCATMGMSYSFRLTTVISP